MSSVGVSDVFISNFDREDSRLMSYEAFAWIIAIVTIVVTVVELCRVVIDDHRRVQEERKDEYLD